MRSRYELAVGWKPTHQFLGLLLGRGGQDRCTRRDFEHERKTRTALRRVLLRILIGKGQRPVRHLQDVIADIAGGRNREARLATRGHRRHPAGEIVVVEKLPGIVERTPADALDGECDRRAHRPALW